MRFDKVIELLVVDIVEDGLGGHTEVENVVNTFNANVEQLGLEATMKIYGQAITNNVKAIVLGKIQLEDNKEYKIKYNEKLYKIVTYRIINNKTSFLMEVINND